MTKSVAQYTSELQAVAAANAGKKPYEMTPYRLSFDDYTHPENFDALKQAIKDMKEIIPRLTFKSVSDEYVVPVSVEKKYMVLIELAQLNYRVTSACVDYVDRKLQKKLDEILIKNCAQVAKDIPLPEDPMEAKAKQIEFTAAPSRRRSIFKGSENEEPKFTGEPLEDEEIWLSYRIRQNGQG